MIDDRDWTPEDPTIPTLSKIQYPPPKPIPNQADVAEIEDQILHLAFGRVMKSIKFRTVALVFFAGVMTGFVGLGVALIVLLDKAGAP